MQRRIPPQTCVVSRSRPRILSERGAEVRGSWRVSRRDLELDSAVSGTRLRVSAQQAELSGHQDLGGEPHDDKPRGKTLTRSLSMLLALNNAVVRENRIVRGCTRGQKFTPTAP